MRAISVHATAGGSAVSVGIFADGAYGAGWNGVGAASFWDRQAGASPVFCTATPASFRSARWSDAVRDHAFGFTYIVFSAVNAVKKMRVSPEVELEGLDVPEFGGLAYPEDALVAAE